MLIAFSSATVAVVAASAPSAAAGGRRALRPKGEIVGRAGSARRPPASRLGSSPSSPAGDECDPGGSSVPGAANEGAIGVDVGALSPRCRPPLQECVPDPSSSLGGRCSDRDVPEEQGTTARSTTAWAQRRLGSRSFGCPATCPAEFCDCATTTEDGYPDARKCATETHAVCSAGLISDCFDEDYADFYESVECELARCLMEGDHSDVCGCRYHQDYCDLYGDVGRSCDVAVCCEEAEGEEERAACLPDARAASGNLSAEAISNDFLLTVDVATGLISLEGEPSSSDAEQSGIAGPPGDDEPLNGEDVSGGAEPPSGEKPPGDATPPGGEDVSGDAEPRSGEEPSGDAEGPSDAKHPGDAKPSNGSEPSEGETTNATATEAVKEALESVRTYVSNAEGADNDAGTTADSWNASAIVSALCSAMFVVAGVGAAVCDRMDARRRKD